MPYIRVEAISVLERSTRLRPMKKDLRILSSRYYLLFAAVLYATGLGVVPLTHAHSMTGEVLRIIALTLGAAYAAGRRNMTVWILWSMFAGVEIGLDATSFALHL